MSYRCELCGVHVPHGNKQLVQTTYRSSPSHKGMEVAGEKAVCRNCKYGVPEGYKMVGECDREHEQEKEPVVLLCDICGDPLGDDGQVTVSGVLCAKHLPNSRGKVKSKREASKSVKPKDKQVKPRKSK